MKMITVSKSRVFRFSDVELRERLHRLTRSGKPVVIEPKALRVLLYLVENAGRVVTKDELLSAVWGDTAVTDNSLTRAVALIRRVLEDDPHMPGFIETVSTSGYRFICPVEVEEESSAESGGMMDGTGREAAVMAASSAGAVASTSAMVAGIKHRRGRRLRLVAAGGVAALGIAAAAWWEWWSAPVVPHVTSIDVLTSDGRSTMWLASDGSRVYYNERVKDRLVLAQVPSAGGETATIATPLTNPRVLDLAPDRSSLLVVEFQSLWIVPLPQGPPRSSRFFQAFQRF